jgi:hypothetical protein
MKRENIDLKDEIEIEFRENAQVNRNLVNKLHEIQQQAAAFAVRIENETQKNVYNCECR